MPESPDFDQIAREIIAEIQADPLPTDTPTTIVAEVAEQLRQVWNARGAADLATKRRWATDQEAAIRALDK